MTPEAGWSGREGHTVVARPDGSLVLMGGFNAEEFMNDVWRSTDQGATWQRLTDDAAWSPRWGHASVGLRDGSIVLMGGIGYFGPIEGNDVWRSTDHGASWTMMTAEAAWEGRLWHTAVALPDDSIVLMGGGAAYVYGDVWRSVDYGATWNLMTDSAEWQGRAMHRSVVLPDDSIILLGGIASHDDDYLNDVWRSTDDGASWQQMTASADWQARVFQSMVALPDGSLVLMGGIDDEGFIRDVWRSQDHGKTWALASSDATWTARFGHATVTLPDGSIVLVGGHDGTGYMRDVWRLATAGSAEQHPGHTYVKPGIYQVTLQVSSTSGYSSVRKPGYVTVTVVATFPVYLPLVLGSTP